MTAVEERVRRQFEGVLEDLYERDPEGWSFLLPDGSARQRFWRAEDGWQIAYTTERVDRGRWAGKFVTMLYKPEGKGARSGKADRYRRTYARPFTSRKAAKARALDLYAEHSPKYLTRAGRWWR